MIHTNHISITPTSTSDFSSAIDRGAAPHSKSDEKSEVLAGVIEVMPAVNYSHSREVLRLLGTSPPAPPALASGTHPPNRNPVTVRARFLVDGT